MNWKLECRYVPEKKFTFPAGVHSIVQNCIEIPLVPSEMKHANEYSRFPLYTLLVSTKNKEYICMYTHTHIYTRSHLTMYIFMSFGLEGLGFVTQKDTSATRVHTQHKQQVLSPK